MLRIPRLRLWPFLAGGLLAAVTLFLIIGLTTVVRAQPDGAEPLPPIIFVARAHLSTRDRIFQDELGPAGQFGTGIPKYAPGSKLVQRDADGTLHVYDTSSLIDVQSPDVNFDATKIVFAGATTLNKVNPDYGWRLYEIDVGDFDGSSLTQLTFSDRSITIPNAGDFGNWETYSTYHDLFPAYLADGRIVFNSSRYPTRAHYDERASFNVYVMNGDGSNLHRITTERAGVLHPTPLPDGRILVARWWNQFNQPSERGIYNRIDDADTSVSLSDGTLILPNPDAQFNPANAILPGGFEVRDAPNTWHLMSLNPDGTDFKRIAWTPRYVWSLTNDSGSGDTYAAAQPAVIIEDGDLANYALAYTSQQDQTMVHTTLETGIRVAYPGLEIMYANATDAIAGLTYEKAWGEDDDSGPYALHPWGLPDGRLLFSQSSEDNSLPTTGTFEDGDFFDLQGSNLRYRLYVMNLDGSGKTLVDIDLSGFGLETADLMDAKPIVARAGWTSLGDAFTDAASDDPLDWNVPNTLAAYAFSQNGPGDIETATVHNPNVYANPSLYSPYVNNSAPPGSVATAELWVDANQFTGAYCYNGWPQPCDTFRRDSEVRAVLWDSVPVSLDGEFSMEVPADVMGFFVLRDANGRLVRGWNRGYATIAQGSAWARPDETVTCIGCHMGHVSGSLSDVQILAETGWQNVAPYATASASSHNPTDYDTFVPAKINDRRGWVPTPAGGPDLAPFFDDAYQAGFMDDETGWISALDQAEGEWVELNWPADQTVTSIQLVAPPASSSNCDSGNYCGGGDWGGFGEPEQYGEYHVEAATLRLYRDGGLIDTISVGRIEPLSNGGTLITLDNPTDIDRLRLTVDEVNGRWYWSRVAALNEIEVIGQAAESWPLLQIFELFLPIVQR